MNRNTTTIINTATIGGGTTPEFDLEIWITQQELSLAIANTDEALGVA